MKSSNHKINLFIRRGISFLISFSLVFVSLIVNINAATVTVNHTSITISNSNPGSVANEDIAWTPSNTSTAVSTIFITYATTATGTTVPTGLSVPATPTISLTGFGAATATGSYASGVLTVTLSTATVASSSGVSVTVDGVTNPSAGVFYVQVNVSSTTATSGTIDYGVMATETVAQVTVSGTMDPSLSFSITGIASGTATSTTGGQNATTVTTTATAIPFGTFLITTTNVAAQQITTTTNANYGYTVTLQENQALTSSSSATIPDVTAGAWTTNSTTGFGVNVTGGDANTTLFTGNTIYEPIPHNTSTLTLATKTSPTSSSGDSEYVNFQLGVTAAQPAGTYTNNIDYVVTPTY